MADFGIGLGFQGQPPLHGQYFNQRQAQEQARRAQRLKHDDEAFSRALNETTINQNDVHWKLQPIARDIVADYAARITKLRQEKPLTWENERMQLKADALSQLANIRASSNNIKNVEGLMAKGEIRAPESLRRYFNTNQGDLKNGLPSLLDQKAYGIIIDPDTYNIGFNPVKAMDVTKEFHTAIGSKKDTYQDEIDPTTGKPKVYTYREPISGAVEYETRRKLLPNQIDETYNSLTSGPVGTDAPHLSQNILLNYLGEKQKQEGFTEDQVMNPDGTWKQSFLTEANMYGRNLAQSIASQYATHNPISRPAVTNVNVNTKGDNAHGVSAISPTTIKIGLPTGEKEEKFDAVSGKMVQADKMGAADVKSPAQFTTPNFKVRSAKTGSVVDIRNNQKVETPGVDNAEYAQFAVIPVFKDGPFKGRAVPQTFSQNEKGSKAFKNRTLEEAIKSNEVEWKVVGIGSYKTGSGEDEEEHSIFRDANELSGAAVTGLPEGDEAGFNKRIGELYKEAERLNGRKTPASNQSASKPATKGTGYHIKELMNAYPGKSEQQVRDAAAKKGYKVID